MSLSSTNTTGGYQRAIAVGTFDGVHLGHQAVLRATAELAERYGYRAAALSFSQHPLALVRPAEAPRLLTSAEEKATLIMGMGIPEVVVVPFDRDTADLSADEFAEMLVRQHGCRALVMGHDNAFGKGRQGNAAYMQALSGRLGFALEVLGPVTVGGSVVSSSAVRQLLADGNVAGARAHLGRSYRVRGTVEHGDGRGRTMGLRTANLDVPEWRVVPGDGVYATRTSVAGRNDRAATWVPSVTGIGSRPTFYAYAAEAPRTVETHLIDQPDDSIDLYGAELDLEFIAYIRDDQRFASTEALMARIRDDIAEARRLLV